MVLVVAVVAVSGGSISFATGICGSRRVGKRGGSIDSSSGASGSSRGGMKGWWC